MKAKAKYLWVAPTGRKQKGGGERRGEQGRGGGDIFNDKKWNVDQRGVGEGAKYEQNVKKSLLIKMRTVKQL